MTTTHLHAHAHLCSWPWKRTDRRLLIPLHLCLPLFFSPLFVRPSVPSVRFPGHVRHCSCVTGRPKASLLKAESRSRVGSLSRRWQGKTRTLTAHVHTHTRTHTCTRAALMRSGTRTREATAARTNLRSYQDNLRDITAPQAQRGRGLKQPTMRSGSCPKSGGCVAAAASLSRSCFMLI